MAADTQRRAWWNRLLGASVAVPAVVIVLLLTSTLWVGGRVRDIRTTPVILQQVQALSRLETARQSSHQVVKAASENPVLGELLSRDELTFIAVVQTTAGVDLSKVQARSAALQRGLLIEAVTNAESALRKLLGQLGYEEVRFVTQRG